MGLFSRFTAGALDREFKQAAAQGSPSFLHYRIGLILLERHIIAMLCDFQALKVTFCR